MNTDGLPTPRRHVAIVAVSCGTALAVLDGAVVNVALPTLARDLQVPASAAVLVVTVYQLMLVMTLLPFSALGDRIGLRRLYQYGQLAFLVSTLLCFFARSLPFLLVARGIQALGAAASLSVSSALIRSIYPSAQMGRGLALNNVVVSSASAIAPIVGGLVLSIAPWPWIFAASTPLAVVSLLLGRRALPAPEPRDEPYDTLGALLCALTFGLIIAGLESGVHGDSPVVSLAIVMLGSVVAVLFVRRERDARLPILPVDLLARPAFALAAFSSLLAFIASMTLLLSLPFRLQHEFNMSPGEMGAMITPWLIALVVVGPLAGWLSDRVSVALLGCIGMSVAVMGLLSIAYWPAHSSHADIAWRMALSGAGFGLFMTPNARSMVDAAPMERAAATGALMSTSRLVGQAFGATLLAALLAAGLGHGRVPALVSASLLGTVLILNLSRLRLRSK